MPRERLQEVDRALGAKSRHKGEIAKTLNMTDCKKAIALRLEILATIHFEIGMHLLTTIGLPPLRGSVIPP